MNQKRDFDPIPKHLDKQYSEGIRGLGYTRDFEYANINDNNKLSFEDSRITKLLFEAHRLIEHIRLQLVVVITILLIIDFDDQYFVFDENTVLWLIFYLNSILLLFTYLTYSVKFNYFKATLLVPPNLSFFKGDFLLPFLIEFFIFLPIPNVFVQNIQFEFTIYRTEGVFYYSMNDLLFLFSCFRSVLLLFILLRLSKIYNSQVHRLSLYFGFRVKWSFNFKSLTSEEPVLVITTIFTVQTIYLTLALWIVERPFERDLHSNTLGLLKHCFYETLLALIRYSYEEYEPFTVMGKVVLAFTQYSGFATTSLLIAAIAARFQMHPRECNSFVLLKRMEHQEKMLIITEAIGEQFYYLMKYPVNPFTNQRAKLCLMYLKQFFHLKRNYHNTISEMADQLFNRKLKDMKLQIEEFQQILKLIAQQQKEIREFYHYQQQLFFS